MPNALIVGISGQDGTLLSEYLRAKEYSVHGLSRAGYSDAAGVLQISGDCLASMEKIEAILTAVEPDEIYYLAAYHQSSEVRGAGPGGEILEQALATNVVGLRNFFECARRVRRGARLFYACSSFVMRPSFDQLIRETSEVAPDTIYGISKATGWYLCRLYREQYGMFTSAGILFNHESHLRNARYLSRKVVDGALRIKRQQGGKLPLGNLDAVVDWSHAKDFVRGFWQVLQQSSPKDYVFASGERHTVREFASIAFDQCGLDWRDYVESDAGQISSRLSARIGDPTRLKTEAGWLPEFTFPEMIRDIYNNLRARLA